MNSTLNRKFFRNVLIAGLLFLGVFVFSGCSSSEEPGIEGFRDYDWGSSPAEVDRTFRDVTYADSEQNTVLPEKWVSGTEWLYREVHRNEDLLDEGYIFHPDQGLVKGYVRVRFGDDDGCLRTYERYRRRFVRRYNLGDRFHIRNGRSNNLDTNFCSAVLVGEATQWDSWKDSRGNKVMMLVGGERSKRRVTVLVESELYYDWKNSPPLVDFSRALWSRFLGFVGGA